MGLVPGRSGRRPPDLLPGLRVVLQAQGREEAAEGLLRFPAEVLVADDVQAVGALGHPAEDVVQEPPEDGDLGEAVVRVHQRFHLGAPRPEPVGHELRLVEKVSEMRRVAELAVAGHHRRRMADQRRSPCGSGGASRAYAGATGCPFVRALVARSLLAPAGSSPMCGSERGCLTVT